MSEHERMCSAYRAERVMIIGRCRVEPHDVRSKESSRGYWTVSRPSARSWAVYLDGELLAVTVYKKGALAVADALNRREVA